MKRFLVIFFLSSFALCAEEEKVEGAKAFSGTIGPVLNITQMGNGALINLGGRINTQLWNMFILGLGAHGTVIQTDLSIAGSPEKIGYFYGAAGLGFRLFPDSFIHFSNYNNFGLGRIELKNRGEKGMAFSIEPELNLEVDLLSLMRIGAGISYRWMFASSLSVPNSALNGVGGHFFVEFGWL